MGEWCRFWSIVVLGGRAGARGGGGGGEGELAEIVWTDVLCGGGPPTSAGPWFPPTRIGMPRNWFTHTLWSRGFFFRSLPVSTVQTTYRWVCSPCIYFSN